MAIRIRIALVHASTRIESVVIKSHFTNSNDYFVNIFNRYLHFEE